MAVIKSLDEQLLIAALLRDVSETYGLVFNTRSLRLTLRRVNSRLRSEGISFLTKTLPRLGKALDSALSSCTKLNIRKLRFKRLPKSELPIFMGEFFSLIFHPDGTVLPEPCDKSVAILRQLAYLFYKYELPYNEETEQKVVDQFEKTEHDLQFTDALLPTKEEVYSYSTRVRRRRLYKPRHGNGETPHPCPTEASPNGDASVRPDLGVVRDAQSLLSGLFAFFDPLAIHPRHGPGAVSTGERLQEKYVWTNVSRRITDLYPYDAYFCASLGHVVDTCWLFSTVREVAHPAKVILVPKDSRGPRLISCEPLDNQWIQQGLGRAIVKLVESNWRTKCQVNFTDQTPNRIAALFGSANGRYATLDLKEASDRVSLRLVRLLFPEYLCRYLECCRSSSTVLPNGQELTLRKFAPMGSALCFPILALTVYAILQAAAPDRYTKDRILVYGDDVVVPTEFAGDAMKHLESFGLLVNRDKSCTGGLFRESCGMDAFRGVDVTPVRFRTPWASHRSPEVYASWAEYANSMYDRRWYRVYDLIVEALGNIYGPMPSKASNLGCPSLRNPPEYERPLRKRWNRNLQKVEYHVLCVKTKAVNLEIHGWLKLLRYFTEKGRTNPLDLLRDPGLEVVDRDRSGILSEPSQSFSVSSYTERRASSLVRRWR